MLKNMKDIKLDVCEQEIEDNIEKSLRLSDEEMKKEKDIAEKAARNHLLKA